MHSKVRRLLSDFFLDDTKVLLIVLPEVFIEGLLLNASCTYASLMAL